MRKSTIAVAAGLALAFPVTMMAGSDYFNIVELMRESRIWIDDVKEMTILKTMGITDGYNTLHVEFNDGTSKDWLMGAIKEMQWNKGYKANSLTVDVEPHHRCVTLNVKCSDPAAHWQVGALPADWFSGMSNHDWSETAYDYERTLIYSYVSQTGGDMNKFKAEDFFFYQGDGRVTWFPPTMEEAASMPGKDYIAYAYQADWKGGPIFEHDVQFVPFTAKVANRIEGKYELNISLTPTSIIADVTSPDNEPYCIFLIPERENDADSDVIALSEIGKLEYIIYNSDGKVQWEDVTETGNVHKVQGGLCSGDKYYVIVAGCEYGEMTTTAVISDLITIPFPTVTDNCTFNVTSAQITPAEVSLTVTPSSSATRYVVVQTGKEGYTNPMEEITKLLYSQLTYGSLNAEPGSDNPYVFRGKSSLSNLKNVIKGSSLISGETYKFYVVGIDENCTPVTAPQSIDYTVAKSEGSMTLNHDFNLTSYIDGELKNPYTRYLWCDITPSDPEAKYVFDKFIRVDDSILTLSDDEIITKYIKAQYGFVTTLSGNQHKSIGCSLDASTDSWDKVYIISFGWDGSATSGLYLFRFDPATGDLETLRSPN